MVQMSEVNMWLASERVQLSVGESHGKFMVEEELEVGL
jgi:hypothetical protein